MPCFPSSAARNGAQGHTGLRSRIALAIVAASLNGFAAVPATSILPNPAESTATRDAVPVGAMAPRPVPPSPVSFWFTPAGGKYGRALGGGGELRFALAGGFGAGLDVSVAEELCILCGRRPEKLRTGALLLGFRGTNRAGYLSVAAGPNWGWGQHQERGPDIPADADCEGLLCWDAPPPAVTTEGFGATLKFEAALAGKYAGVGAQAHFTYLPGHFYPGISLILPFGKIR
jgi:hypothetical protein